MPQQYFPEDNGLNVDRYYRSVDKMVSGKVSHQFRSTELAQAVILLATILNHSKSEVRILARSFRGYIYEHPMFLDALKKYLGKGGKLKLLLTNNTDNPNFKLLSIISKYSNAEIKTIIASELVNFSIFSK